MMKISEVIINISNKFGEKMKKNYLIVITVIISILLSSCAVPIHSIGFIDEEGKWIFEPYFFGGQVYSEGLIAVNWGGGTYGKWGFSDIYGNTVIDFIYDDVLSFYEGYAPVMIKSDKGSIKWFYIDKEGNHAFDGKYFFEALVFSEGLAPVQSMDKDTYGKWGYINTKGEYVIKPQFGQAGVFKEGLAMIRDGIGESGLCGYINTKGEIVIEPLYTYCGVFSEGLAPVKITYKMETPDWGYIDKKGNIIIDFKYGYAKSFKEGLAPVIEGDPQFGKFKYIDKKGNTVIEDIFYDANPFYEGKAAVRRYPDPNSGWGYIDTKGNLIIGGEFASCLDYNDGYAVAGLIIKRK